MPVEDLEAMIREYVGGLGSIRAMEEMIQHIHGRVKAIVGVAVSVRADLRIAPPYGGDEQGMVIEVGSDMLTTLAAENATLRAENEELDFLRHEGGPDSVAAMETELATLRASEAAALEALAEIGEVVAALEGADSLDKEMIRNIRTRIAALTPTADKEPKT